MAGRGPAPKPAGQKARRNKDVIPSKVLPPVGIVPQPELPDTIQWHPRTVEWWAAWGRTPQALGGMFAESDWSFLMDTALIHHEIWNNGDLKMMGELRLREAKVGATVEDRARLRITFADAEVAESRVASARDSAKTRRAQSHVVDVQPVAPIEDADEDDPDAIPF